MSAVIPVDEPVTTTSARVVLAGFVLIVGVLILFAFIAGGRGERNDVADAFGIRVTIAEITGRYLTTYTPRKFWPSPSDAQAKSLDDFSKRSKSFLYSTIWIFLMSWLFCAGVFLISAGGADTIEVFREQEHLIAAVCVALALFFGGIWIIVFRLGSKSQLELKELNAGVKRIFEDERDNKDPFAPPKTAMLPEFDGRKRVWLWIAFVVLLVAWIFALVATISIRAWTLPGQQYGTLLFLGPGYGLFTGWLFFATTLNYGIATSARSYPDCTKPPPDDAVGSTAYKASPVPVIAAVILLIPTVAIPDPVQPFPMVVALLFFTPRFTRNLFAAAIGVVAIAIGVFRVYSLR